LKNKDKETTKITKDIGEKIEDRTFEESIASASEVPSPPSYSPSNENVYASPSISPSPISVKEVFINS
jgi:hypothetical protein